MPIVEQYIDAANKIRITWEQDGEYFHFKFNSEPSELELQKAIDAAILNLEVSNAPFIGDYLQIQMLLVPLIENIKNGMIKTYSDYQQFNPNYDWASSIQLQSFLLDFSIKNNSSETASLEECFQNFYSFVIENSNEKIAKSIFYGVNF